MADLEIQIRSIKDNYVYGEPLALHCEGWNASQGDLFIVKDRIRKIKESGNTLRVLVGHTKPTVRLGYYEYQPPTLQQLPSGQNMSSEIKLGMPLRESEIGTDDLRHYKEIDLYGDVEVYLVVGYGKTEFCPKTLDAFGKFLSWQHLTTSNRITVQIRSPYY